MLQATQYQKDIETVKSKATSIHAYAKWLEEAQTNWWDFPVKERDRCLVKYRGFLISSRKANLIAPSTASQRMRVAIQFYRWLRHNGLISPEWPMWRERFLSLKFNNAFGFERTFAVNSTNLSIPNRSSPGEKLEDGLYPVSENDRSKILEIAREHCSTEIHLLLMAGFFTGMRIQTLSDLTIPTLENAVQDPSSEGLYRLAVGPGATPPVATKNGVTGHVWITKPLLDSLKEYCYSAHRLLRESKAKPEYKNHVFLTRFGNLYSVRDKDRSPALNVAMHNLRAIGRRHGVNALNNFKFHQTRCTFATSLARLAIRAGGAIHAIAIVKEALLHRDESTTIRYIRFVEKTPIKISMANEFTKAFFGATGNSGGNT
ncbi:MAG: site-specific integrase [Gammaproteobacteria bacterium]|nr:site-specific integrase [Gammaproteobacteria bacterium]